MKLSVAVFPPGQGTIVLTTQNGNEEDKYLVEGAWLYDFITKDWYKSHPKRAEPHKFTWSTLGVNDELPSEVKAAFLLIKE